MRVAIFAIIILIISNCTSITEFNPVGLYSLEVEGIRSIDSGRLEVLGEPGDYFGLLTFEGTRKREYSVGLEYLSADSMSFFLSGDGYLRIARQDTKWVGEFKYFGLNGIISGSYQGVPSYPDNTYLIRLKPIGLNIISTKEQETFPTYDSNRNILFFTRSNRLFESYYRNGSWSKPEQLPFSDEFDDSAPYLTEDGNTMIFTSTSPAFGATESTRKNIWKVDRNNEESWGIPEVYPEPVNIDSLGEYHAGITADNSLYFVSYNRDGGFGRSDLYKAVESNSEYVVENLGPSINTEFSEADIYIDPDERFLLFISTSREDSNGLDDIYISVNENGNWTDPENLGPSVNSYGYEYGPWIDSTNKMFYFNSDRRGSADIYQVPINEIPKLIPFFD